MDARLRSVIIGAGMIGSVHRRASILAAGDIVGVLAGSPESTSKASDKWGVPALASLDDLARVKPDVVHVCTPNGLHAEQVKAAIDAGAHVICEKPMSISSEEADQMVDWARQAGVIATVPFVYRFHPLVREIRARVRKGEFGRWQLLHGSYLQDWLLSREATSWRVDAAAGGPSRAFADIGSHWCDLMEFVTGERIESLSAEIATTVPSRPRPGGAAGERIDVTTEDVASIVFRTQTGVLGTATISQVSAGRKNRLWFEFDGEHRSAVFDQESPETVWLGTLDAEHIVRRDPRVGSDEQRRLSVLPAGHAQGYAECFDAFVADTYAVIRGEEREGLPTFADGLRSSKVVDAVVKSAQSGKRVHVEG